ncbi:hypothetical protein XBO1_1370008 [Xenorhabdus bovienii str. oregonense]|uniref:Uncharacterized protein n=1 Tax=Xenorhabdus bovienii str. oregonense TaxID=1398202 RepID=A0A077NRJ4_XENBV|nr:hypothetical protein XBO1_1370008 [Xenorhabdus bovienii str. oregonense]
MALLHEDYTPFIQPLSGFSCQNVERLTVDQLCQKLKHLDTLMLISG